jgi:hypothetical protein
VDVVHAEEQDFIFGSEEPGSGTASLSGFVAIVWFTHFTIVSVFTLTLPDEQ